MLQFIAKGEGVVNDELSFEFLLCGDYEKLLNACQHDLDHWNAHSETIREQQLTGDATGRELLRLQARFAKSYTILQRHIENCERCQLAARMSHSMSDSDTRLLAGTAN